MNKRSAYRLWLVAGVMLLAAAGIVILPALAGAQGTTKTVTLRVDGMVCPVCEHTVDSVATGMPGVISARASRITRTVVLAYDPSRVSPQQVADRINAQTYYRARVLSPYTKTVALRIPDMGTREAAERVTAVLRAAPGIEGGTLNFERLDLDYDARKTSPQQIVALITARTGFAASVDTASQSTSAARSTGKAVIRVAGMTDQRTASQVTSALRLDGIVDGSVDLHQGTLTVVYDTAKLTPEQIVDALRGAVRNRVRLLSAEGSSSGGTLLSSPWLAAGVPGVAILAVLAWPALRRRRALTAAGKAGGRR
jgi:copper chaperone CopZ